MRLTTKGRFAVTAMIDLALRQGKGPVTLSGISQRQAISLSYLEQLFGKLRRHEIVESIRGPGGGYSLARAAEKVTVADIIANLVKNAENAQRLVQAVVAKIDDGIVCKCHSALKNAIITSKDAMPDATKKKLDLLIGKYV